MYFLEQIRRQFIAQCMSYVEVTQGGPEGPLVQPTAEVGNTSPEDTFTRAQDTCRTLDLACETEEARGLLETPMSPATQAYIDGVKGEGKITEFSSPEAKAAYKELGLEHVLAAIGTDAPEQGEVIEKFVESSPEQLQGSLDLNQQERAELSKQIVASAENPQIQKELIKRQSFLLGLANIIARALSPEDNPGTGVEGYGKGVMARAGSYLGIDEDTGAADRFLLGQAQNARKTPWCAGFVSTVCLEAGYDFTPTLSSREFIGQGGKGHVAFNAGNGQMLGGNQDDKVSIVNIKKEVEGWVMPEDIGKEGKTYTRAGNAPANTGEKDPFDPSNIPIGAIIVFKRNVSETNVA